MKNVLFGSLIFMCFFVTIVNADSSYHKVFETELYERSDLDYYNEKQKNFFVKNDIISVSHRLEFNIFPQSTVFDGYFTFHKYDKNGKLINEKEIKILNLNDYYSSFGLVEQSGDCIYVFTNGIYDNKEGFLLLKVDSDLNVSVSKVFSNFDIFKTEYFPGFRYVTISDGNIIFSFEEYDEEKDAYSYKINMFDLEKFEGKLVDDEELLKKYFPNIGSSSNSDGLNYIYTIYKDNKYTFNKNTSLDYANLVITSNGEEKLSIDNKTYESFEEGAIIDNYILLIAKYEDNLDLEYYDYSLFDVLNKKSDLLIYDMNGNLVDTITTNANYENIEVKDDEFLVSRFYADGVCLLGGRYYSIKKECKTYIQRILYSFSADDGVLNENENSTTQNPDTTSLPIICTILIALGIMMVFFKSYNSLKNID